MTQVTTTDHSALATKFNICVGCGDCDEHGHQDRCTTCGRDWGQFEPIEAFALKVMEAMVGAHEGQHPDDPFMAALTAFHEAVADA